ncbi:MAG: hypothetical protein GF315_09490 [candidate division Zixibacteria bacterium]|nr:hypothetical protein [candidate division Zixibacteria bacterium]
MERRLLSGLALSVFLPAVILAIPLQEYYETDESVLENYYISGELTHEQYLELLELYESGELVDTTEAYSIFDIQQAVREFMSQQTVKEPDEELGLSVDYKARQSYDLGESVNIPSQIYRVECSYTNRWHGLVEFKRRPDSPNRIHRRSLNYRGSGSIGEISLGNFTTDLGLGLNVGRRDYFEYDNYTGSGNADFRRTTSSSYNGAFARFSAYGFNPWLLYSTNRYIDFRMSNISFGTETVQSAYTTGVSISISQIYPDTISAKVTLRNYGLYLLHDAEDISYGAEISSSGKEHALVGIAKLRASRAMLTSSFWFYSENYANLTSGGISENEDRTYHIENTDVSYQNDNRDRAGASIKGNYDLSELLTLTGAAICYSKGKDPEPSYTIMSGFKIRQKSAFTLRVRFGFGDDIYYGYRSGLIFSQGYLLSRLTESLKSKLEFSYKRRKFTEDNFVGKPSGKIAGYIFYNITKDMMLEIGAAAKRRVWIDTYNNYTELWFAEKFRILRSAFLTLRVVMRNGYGSSTAYANFEGAF